MEKIKLGQEVKDRITGFKGIAVGRTTYLQGCDRIQVAPKVDKDGDIKDTQHFDEPDLIIIGVGVAPPKPKEPKGGPREVSFKREL